MNTKKIKIEWPNGKHSYASAGSDWLSTANNAGVLIPTGCLSGSCGACEIEVNGKVVRACISNVPITNCKTLKIKFSSDPFW